jgi:hypothetical protein
MIQQKSSLRAGLLKMWESAEKIENIRKAQVQTLERARIVRAREKAKRDREERLPT